MNPIEQPITGALFQGTQDSPASALQQFYAAFNDPELLARYQSAVMGNR
jgi:hypothetical protein